MRFLRNRNDRGWNRPYGHRCDRNGIWLEDVNRPVIESAEFAGKLVVTIGFGTIVCGSAVIIQDVVQGVHPGRLAILVTYSGWSLVLVGAGMIVSVTVWPETLLVGLPFIAFGLWVARRGVARSDD